MSYCITIKTRKKLIGEDVVKALAEQGEQICVTSIEFPCVKFGVHFKSLRGIEINKEKGGYEVRICSFASKEDYRIFRNTVKLIASITGGKVYDDDDELLDVNNIDKILDNNWIEQERESSFMITRAMTVNIGHKLTMDGMFLDICIGPHLLAGLEIPLYGDYKVEYMDSLQDYLVNLQWFFGNKKDTSTRMVIPNSEDESKQPLTISMICIQDGKVNDFDYISNASLLGIMDLDHSDVPPVLVDFEYIGKILDPEKFRIFDEFQYERTGDITPESVRQMMELARPYQREDLHSQPVRPSEGFDEKQRTFILMWNPDVSSVKLADHNASIARMCTEYFNWSVWDYDKVRVGDRFFLVKVGKGKNGIVMSGVFNSAPFEDEDWSGKGRQTYYVDMLPNCIINPEVAPMVTTEDLSARIPNFDWSGGHSGRVLPSDSAEKLETIWAQFMNENCEHIDHETFNAYYVESFNL